MVKNIRDIDQFVVRTTRYGTGLMFMVPARHIAFSGIKEGDIVKVYFKRMKDGNKILNEKFSSRPHMKGKKKNYPKTIKKKKKR